jgi:hypothetical protein
MSYLKESDLLKSFKSYLLDIKPYHTKLDGIYAEYLFQDRFQVTVTENRPLLHVYLSNIFNVDTFGGWRLFNTIDSSVTSRKFQIPQTIIPRFSINSFNEQFPVGHNPATEDSIPPVNEVPWAPPGSQLTRQGWSYSHQSGISDALPFIPEVARTEIEITNISSIVGGIVTFTYSMIIYYDASNLYGGDIASGPSVYRNGISLGTSGPGIYFNHDGTHEKITIFNLTKVATVTLSGSDLLLSLSLNGSTRIINLNNVSPLSSVIIDGADVNVSQTIPLITPLVKDVMTIDNQGIHYEFLDSGSYQVPYHNGSYITVNGVEQIFGVDYIVPKERDKIQFLSSKHPSLDDDIRINYFNVDRLFISITKPFDIEISDGYDDRSYDSFPYDTSTSSTSAINTDYFELIVDESLPGGYSVEFFNAVEGSVKASIQNVIISNTANNLEKWTITATGPKSLKVTGSITGDAGYAYYRQPYDNGKISFIIKNTFLSYYMVPDNPQPPQLDVGETSTYSDIDFNLFNIFTFGGSKHTQDYLINLNLKSTHGISDDFNSQSISYFDDPVDIAPFGKISVDKDQRYFFELNDLQPLGTVVEFAIEQNSQYNTWVQVDIKENLHINDINLTSDYLDLVSNGYDIPDFDAQRLDTIVDRDIDGTLHNEPYQIASAGIKDSLQISINYVDATPDIILVQDIMYSKKFSQSSAINEIILNKLPLVTFTGVGNANGYLINANTTNQETWTIVATSATTFSVNGSISGSQAAATVDIPYSNSLVEFKIVNGSLPFDVGDTFTFNIPSSYVVTSLDSGSELLGVITPDVIYDFYTTNESPVVVGTGDGVIKVTNINQSTAVEENWTISAINSTTFSVVGSISGSKPNATVGSSYSNIISFKITAGGTAFIAGDTFTISVRENWNKIHFKFNSARTFDVYNV